jgi:hypothetical protein
MRFSSRLEKYLILLILTVLSGAVVSCAQPVKLANPLETIVHPKTVTTVQTVTAPATDSAVTPASENIAAFNELENSENRGVEIVLIHYQGSFQPLGCCDIDRYERNEFVAIQNKSKTPQSIIGWKLVNLNKDYITFTFPQYFPCIPYSPAEGQYAVNTKSFIASAPQTVEQVFSTPVTTVQQPAETSEVDWSSCSPIDPLDETPMKPLPNQEPGKPLPCILQPGQLALIFTDEIHCQYGGFSFKYGAGNIWNNTKADTAVLYDAQGKEVSRKSYTTVK